MTLTWGIRRIPLLCFEFFIVIITWYWDNEYLQHQQCEIWEIKTKHLYIKSSLDIEDTMRIRERIERKVFNAAF
jgi:hypothetical protein